MLEKYSIIHKGIVVDIAEGDYIHLRNKYKNDCIIIPFEEHHKLNMNLYLYVFKTNKQKIEDGELILKENEFFDEKSDSIIEIREDQKLILNEDGSKSIIDKTIFDKYIEGQLSDNEYNEQIINKRVYAYQELDNKRLEVVDKVLTILKDNNLLTEEINKEVQELIDIRKNIKEEYPKIGDKKFNSKIKEVKKENELMLQNLSENKDSSKLI